MFKTLVKKTYLILGDSSIKAFEHGRHQAVAEQRRPSWQHSNHDGCQVRQQGDHHASAGQHGGRDSKIRKYTQFF